MLARLGALLTVLTLTAAPVASAAPDDFDLQAHRGGRGETTEESLRAFTKALQLGVTTLELDIVLSKDAAPMVWHDSARHSFSTCRPAGFSRKSW